MPKIYLVLTLIFFTASCKKDAIDPVLLKFKVLSNHFIYSAEDPDQSIKYNYPINAGSAKSVVFYNSDPTETGCCDRGAPFVAFEIGAGVNSFTYSDSASLKKAHCMTGMTGSIAGPLAYPLRNARISGTKISKKEWVISIEVPVNSSLFFRQLNFEQTFPIY